MIYTYVQLNLEDYNSTLENRIFRKNKYLYLTLHRIEIKTPRLPLPNFTVSFIVVFNKVDSLTKLFLLICRFYIYTYNIFCFTLATDPLLPRKAPSHVGPPQSKTSPGRKEMKLSCFIQYITQPLPPSYTIYYLLFTSHTRTPSSVHGVAPLPDFRNKKSGKF